jgi:hypothetical protein
MADSSEEDLIQSDLYAVGKNKPLGYLPLQTIMEDHGYPQKLKADLERGGRKCIMMGYGECRVREGALYVYDEDALRGLLAKPDNKGTLDDAGWPSDPEAFVRKVAAQHTGQRCRLFDLVADAFADYENTGRLINPNRGEIKRT